MDIISIIVPCYNCERFVAHAIASVKSQTSDRWECIIVDDGSTDNSLSVINGRVSGDDKFKVFHTENKGVAQARNLAITHAVGKYILPLDSDDALSPKTVETYLKYWELNPDASLLVGKVRRYRVNGDIVIQKRLWKGYDHLKLRCTPNNSSCYKKSDWERVGGYRDGTMYEDWEFWIRLLYKNDNVINIPEVLTHYRMRMDSRWHTAVKRHEAEVEIIKQMNKEIYGRD